MVVDGTTYHDETPREVVRVLESARHARQRIRVHYGDRETGRDWGDVYDVEGYVGRSMGPMMVPLMIYREGTMGGPAMLDHCIVRIRPAGRAGRKRDLYRHPHYSPPPREDHPADWERHFKSA